MTLNKEKKKEYAKRWSGQPGHAMWRAMVARCHQPRWHNYRLYGGRGVSVCDRWRDYHSWYADWGHTRPSPKHSQDRIDNNGNYEPGNMKWSTTKEQGNNRSTNKFLECRGERMTVAQWADRVGVDRALIRRRLAAGREVEDAIFTPSLRQ